MSTVPTLASTAGVDPFQPMRDRIATARGRRLAAAIRIRPIAPADLDDLRAFYAGLSDESRRTRFLGPTSGIYAGQSAYFCCPDHAHREGFVAVIGPAAGPDRIVGHVCVEPDGPASAEIALAVADEVQGRGIGRNLVKASVAWARRDGFQTLTATMLAANPPIQRLLSSLDLPSSAVSIGAGIVEIRIDLCPAALAHVHPRTIDARARSSPGPLLELIGAIRVARVGDLLAVLSSDSRSRSDVPKWIAKAGHRLIGVTQRAGFDEVIVEKMR